MKLRKSEFCELNTRESRVRLVVTVTAIGTKKVISSNKSELCNLAARAAKEASSSIGLSAEAGVRSKIGQVNLLGHAQVLP